MDRLLFFIGGVITGAVGMTAIAAINDDRGIMVALESTSDTNTEKSNMEAENTGGAKGESDVAQ